MLFTTKSVVSGITVPLDAMTTASLKLTSTYSLLSTVCYDSMQFSKISSLVDSMF